jgi:hypothetical protein
VLWYVRVRIVDEEDILTSSSEGALRSGSVVVEGRSFNERFLVLYSILRGGGVGLLYSNQCKPLICKDILESHYFVIRARFT